MEPRRNSYWADSITTIMRKTEVNLHRIQTPLHQLYEEQTRPATSIVYQTNSEHQDHRSRPRTALSSEDPASQLDPGTLKTQIEKIVTDYLKFQRNDINSLNERVALFEVQQVHFENFKETSQRALTLVENKCSAETRRLEEIVKGVVTQEDLKVVEESIKNAHLYQIAQIELDFRELKSEMHGIKEEAFIMIENRLREAAKSMLTPKELNNLKQEIIKETETQIQKAEKAINDQWATLQNSNEKTIQSIESKLKEFNYTLIERLGDADKDSDKKVNSVKTYTNDECAKLRNEIKRLENAFSLDDLDYEVEKLKKQMSNLPKDQPNNLTNYVTKQEYESSIQQIKKETSQFQANLDTVGKKDIDMLIQEINRRFEENKSDQFQLSAHIENITSRLEEIEVRSSEKSYHTSNLIESANPKHQSKESAIKTQDIQIKNNPVTTEILIPKFANLQNQSVVQSDNEIRLTSITKQDVLSKEADNLRLDTKTKISEVIPVETEIEKIVIPVQREPVEKAQEKMDAKENQVNFRAANQKKNDLLDEFINDFTSEMFNTEVKRCLSEVKIVMNRNKIIPTKNPYSSYNISSEPPKQNTREMLKNKPTLSPNQSFTREVPRQKVEINNNPKEIPQKQAQLIDKSALRAKEESKSSWDIPNEEIKKPQKLKQDSWGVSEIKNTQNNQSHIASVSANKSDPWNKDAKKAPEELGDGFMQNERLDTGSSFEINNEWNLGFAQMSPEKKPITQPPKVLKSLSKPDEPIVTKVSIKPVITDSSSDQDSSIDFEDVQIPI